MKKSLVATRMSRALDANVTGVRQPARDDEEGSMMARYDIRTLGRDDSIGSRGSRFRGRA
jgi:hypothetical protein